MSLEISASLVEWCILNSRSWYFGIHELGAAPFHILCGVLDYISRGSLVMAKY
jgi:hypothetical protein